MPKIKIMSDNLANKIAAGEVVEKCSSVVKELVENSIDAQSDNIKIELRNGGLSQIKVIDNGNGMEHEDALLSFQRHATSKLIKEDDLFFINTLGFRGEALPSIASVSEVDLITCATKIGTHLNIKGGKLIIEENSDARKGTIIDVTNLFYNTPARLKYLKSEQYELANTVAYIEKIALSYPNIKFELTNNDKTILKTSGSNNLLKTIHEIYGLNVSSNMIEVNGHTDDYDMEGYICKPEILKSNRNHMTTIVNGRVVKNNDLNKAINDAYFRYKPDIKYPIVVLKFYTDPTLIDVNIHPTKQDIKFSKIEELSKMVTETISNKLTEELLIPDILKKENINIELPKNMTNEIDIKEEKENIQTELNLFEETPPIKTEEPKTIYKSIQERVLNPEMQILNLEVMCQVLGTYIVCQNKDGLYLIDQHAAQERINYEKVQEQFENQKIDVITTLIPINIELNSADFLKIKENINIIEELGFTIEEFGINTYTIKSHPSWIKEGEEENIIRSIFDEIINMGTKFDRVRFNNKIISTIACKMSVRANTRLTIEEMKEIVKELVRCKNPYNCAHGRPSIVKFSNYELEKMFRRVMN